MVRAYDWVEHATTALLAALDTGSGRVIGRCFRERRTTEFVRFLYLLDEAMPSGLNLYSIRQDCKPHKTAEGPAGSPGIGCFMSTSRRCTPSRAIGWSRGSR